MFENSEGQGEKLQNSLADDSLQCLNSGCWLLCYGEDWGLSTVSNGSSGDMYPCSSSANRSIMVLTECTMALVSCWLRLLGSPWGWLRFSSKEDFEKWREVKNNLGMKLYLFHIVCTGVSCTWFVILYRHLGQGVGLMLSCESWENAKFCLLILFSS